MVVSLNHSGSSIFFAEEESESQVNGSMTGDYDVFHTIPLEVFNPLVDGIFLRIKMIVEEFGFHPINQVANVPLIFLDVGGSWIYPDS
jgi:hypothetical protein